MALKSWPAPVRCLQVALTRSLSLDLTSSLGVVDRSASTTNASFRIR